LTTVTLCSSPKLLTYLPRASANAGRKSALLPA
jgi:hypothetical protein